VVVDTPVGLDSVLGLLIWFADIREVQIARRVFQTARAREFGWLGFVERFIREVRRVRIRESLMVEKL
jgi:hypothetical protein